MNNDRPVIVLVFAILNIVFGGLGILCTFCSGISMGLSVGLMNAAGSSMLSPIPSSVVVTSIIEYAIGFLLCGALAGSGIGMLALKPWARRLCVAVSAISIVYAIAMAGVKIGYVNPTVSQWQSDFQERMAREQQRQGIRQGQVNFQVWQSPAVTAAFTILSALLIVGYAIALIVVMFLPQVSAAFAGRRIRRRLEREREPGYEVEE